MLTKKSFTESPNFVNVEIGKLLDFYQRPCKLNADEIYQLVTVKRRNEGIIDRGLFKGSDIKTPSQFYIYEGDFLISKRQIVHGACEIVPPQFDQAIVSNEYAIVRGKDGIISTEYFNLLSKTRLMKQNYFLSSYGVDIEKMVFNVEDWKKRSVCIPSLEEQNRVVEFFKMLNKKIQLQQEKINLLKEQKKGIMRKVFNQEFRFKSDNGQNFPDWTTIPTGELGEIVTGTTPNTKKKSYYDNGSYPWVTPTDIIQKNIHITARKLTEIGISNGRLLPKNTILVTCIASIGKNAILKEVGSCNQQINAIICKENYHYEFVYYLMEINKEKLQSLAGQGTMPIVNKETFSKMLINVACLEEQKKIGELLSTIDKKIAKQKIYLKELNNQKQAFTQQMFL